MRKMIIFCDGCEKKADITDASIQWRPVQAHGPNGYHSADACSSECEPKAHAFACAVRDHVLTKNVIHEKFMSKMAAANEEMKEANAATDPEDKEAHQAAHDARAMVVAKAQQEHDEELLRAAVEFKSKTGREPS